MPFLEFSLTVDSHGQPRAEATLDELGALAVTLTDANADTPVETAIFEPRAGEMPLWHSITLLALFEATADPDELVRRLHAALPEVAAQSSTWRAVADQHWERAWMDRFGPMRFGRRLWIYPWHTEPAADPRRARVIVRLDPGLAFGTGTHPTTAGCLEWLDTQDLRRKTVLDYGCGSGVLAIAALKLGAARAIGVDHDPQALAATWDNATRNGVAGHLECCAPQQLPQALQVDVAVANILAGPLYELAPRLAALCRPGARLVLSGILAAQADPLVARYRGCGFSHLRTTRRGDWLRIDGRRASLRAVPQRRRKKAKPGSPVVGAGRP